MIVKTMKLARLLCDRAQSDKSSELRMESEGSIGKEENEVRRIERESQEGKGLETRPSGGD